MIPIRDDSEHRRPPVLTLAAAALAGAAALATLGGGHLLPAALLVLDAGALWLFGNGAEAAAGRPWTLAALLFGGLGGAALALAAGASGFAPIAGGAATAAAAEMVLIHLIRRPGATVLTLVPVPLFAGFAEVPAPVWAALWAAAAIGLLAAGALEA